MASPSLETSKPNVPEPPAKPLLQTPEDPKSPWLVMLHGYGSNHHDFSDVAALAHAQGFGTLSVPAPVVMRPNSYSWPKGSPEQTHAYLQSVLTAHGVKPDAKVFLAGFSQGALHSAWLTLAYPERYAGVLAISPGGWTDDLPSRAPERPLCLIGGDAELPRHKAKFELVQSAWSGSTAAQKTWRHAGGHHFPASWRVDFADCFSSVFGISKNL